MRGVELNKAINDLVDRIDRYERLQHVYPDTFTENKTNLMKENLRQFRSIKEKTKDLPYNFLVSYNKEDDCYRIERIE